LCEFHGVDTEGLPAYNSPCMVSKLHIGVTPRIAA